MEDINLSVSSGSILFNGTLSEEEEFAVKAKLWQFLAKRTEHFTLGDSSSVTVETAQELLTSISFILDQYLKESGNSQKMLATEELDTLFNLGIRIMESKIKTGRRLWQTACLGAPRIENASYRDTLRNIGGFFKRYDYRFFAHRISCDIDYQLCHPVPDSALGIEYINNYLRRIIIENRFLSCFDSRLVIHLLESCCPDYKGLLINLCEPAIINALGLTLIGGDPFLLEITDADRAQLAALFEPLSEAETCAYLSKAAIQLYGKLGLSGIGGQEYLGRTAAELYPRISAALPTGRLDGIFIPLT